MTKFNTGVACQIEKRKFIGYEMEKRYFEIAEKRLENEYSTIESVLF